MLNEAVGGEPKAIQEQLDKAKAMQMEIVTQARLIETAKQAAKYLLDALGPDESETERSAIESTVVDLDKQFDLLKGAMSDRTQELETALVHSQGVQDGIDSLLGWLNDVENQLRNQQKPVSLFQERLEEQIRDHKLLQTDIDSHRPSIVGIAQSAEDLIRSGSNARIAKKIESKLKELTSR